WSSDVCSSEAVPRLTGEIEVEVDLDIHLSRVVDFGIHLIAADSPIVLVIVVGLSGQADKHKRCDQRQGEHDDEPCGVVPLFHCRPREVTSRLTMYHTAGPQRR